MNFLYHFRGVILGIFAVALWAFPHSSEWIPASAGILALLGIVLRVEARRVIGEHTSAVLLKPEPQSTVESQK